MAKINHHYVDQAPRRDESSRSSGPFRHRTTLPGAAAGAVMENVVSDIFRAGKRTGYRGVVDVEISLHNTVIDSNGFIVALFAGKESKQSSVSVKLATRVELADLDV